MHNFFLNGLKMTRKSGLNDVDKGESILGIIEEDLLSHWGGCLVKKKLRLTGTQVSRDVI